MVSYLFLLALAGVYFREVKVCWRLSQTITLIIKRSNFLKGQTGRQSGLFNGWLLYSKQTISYVETLMMAESEPYLAFSVGIDGSWMNVNEKSESGFPMD